MLWGQSLLPYHLCIPFVIFHKATVSLDIKEKITNHKWRLNPTIVHNHLFKQLDSYYSFYIIEVYTHQRMHIPVSKNKLKISSVVCPLGTKLEIDFLKIIF